MVLDEITDGASRHIQDFYDEGTRRLIFILCLPLIDGVFAMLLVTGTVNTFSNAVAVALTVFTGAGALAVLYSYADTVEEAKNMVLKASPILLAGALAIALVAPVFGELFYIDRLRYAAGLVLLVMAGHLSDLKIAERFSTPAIILTGLVLSIKNPGALAFSSSYIMPALLTAAVAASGLYIASYLVEKEMSLYYIRRGGAAVLAIIAASLFGYNLPSSVGIAVFAASVFASLRA